MGAVQLAVALNIQMGGFGPVWYDYTHDMTGYIGPHPCEFLAKNRCEKLILQFCEHLDVLGAYGHDDLGVFVAVVCHPWVRKFCHLGGEGCHPV